MPGKKYVSATTNRVEIQLRQDIHPTRNHVYVGNGMGSACDCASSTDSSCRLRVHVTPKCDMPPYTQPVTTLQLTSADQLREFVNE